MKSLPPDIDVEDTRVSNIAELQQELRSRSQRDRAYLIVLTGSNVGEMFRIEAGEAVIGRGQGVAVRLLDDGISRKHARVFQEGDKVVIEDLQSSNGTYVNGDQVTLSELHDGDKIRLGSTTVLKFSYHDHLDESFQQQMYDAALRDALTRAFNKKYFIDRLDTEIAYARRHKQALSLLMFDVDFFKRVNDTHGHLAGDFVLARLARLAHGTVRTEDVFARYGGEEFGVICRGVGLFNAGILGERLRTMVAAHGFEYEGKRLPITISVGVAAYPEIDAKTSTELIAASDEALYEAKRTGRNRVLLKQSLHPELYGEPKKDWLAISGKMFVYPAGTGASWHNDGGMYRGAFIYYAHPHWDAQWGGQLLVADPSARETHHELVAEKNKAQAGEPHRERKHYFGSPVLGDDALMKRGIGSYVMPKPNRLVLLSGDNAHMVMKVSSAAGNRCRMSVAGFFLTPSAMADTLSPLNRGKARY
jgi:two-component system cell cycle response regulator